MDRAEREELQRNLVRLADGDRSAFAPVFEKAWPLLRRFSVRALRSEADGEDAAQAALLQLFSRASELDRERDAVAFVLGIAAWECRSTRRRAFRRREEQGDALEACADGGDPEAALIAADLEAALLEAVGTLRPGDAEALRSALAGERPEGATFRKRLSRAMERLRVAWKERHGAD
jgi:DNA-directed RNA polymerase specialized sigma24 family protein